MEARPQCYYFFRTYTINNLNKARDELVREIEKVLGLRVYPPDELKIVPINAFIQGPHSTIARGEYNPITKTIILSNELWCRKTFIHELLHAISYFSYILELYELLKRETEFIEGLTEFLTGYVLYSKYRDCYIEWISQRYPMCSISYEKYVRFFGAVSQVLISISDLIKIYVYNPNLNWFEEYKKFLDRYGLEDFLINKPRKKRKDRQ